MNDEQTARDHIIHSDWFGRLAGEAGRLGPEEVFDLLDKYHKAARRSLENGSWRQDFAGKEILRDIAGWMCDRQRIPGFPSSEPAFYSDIAKHVARWQVANRKLPSELSDLLRALRSRVRAHVDTKG